MGLSVVATVAILSIVVIAAFNVLFIEMNDYAEKVLVPLNEKGQILEERIRTNIDIVNVTAGSATAVYVKNTGSTIINPQDVFLSINDVWVPEADYSIGGLGYFSEGTAVESTDVYNSSNSSQIIGYFDQNVVTSQFVYSNSSQDFYWAPSEILLITTDYSSPGTGDVVKVMVEETFDQYRIG